MAGRLWFPKDYKDEGKIVKKALIEMTKEYNCIYDVKVQTTVYFPKKYYTDIIVYINEPLYVAYLLGGGKKLDIEAPKFVSKRYPIKVKLINK